MTTAPPTLSLNEALTQVAQQGLRRVKFEAVKDAALAVWHGTESPDLEDLHGPHVLEAVQLVERLSYYNVVPQYRKKALLGSTRKALAFSFQSSHTDFESAYKAVLPQLQPLQTRHYAAALV